MVICSLYFAIVICMLFFSFLVMGIGFASSKGDLILNSSAFKNNDYIPYDYTYLGERGNPPLVFENVPEETKTFVLIVDDPDAPSGTFVHFIAYNIPKDIRHIEEGKLPKGCLFGKNSLEETGYVPPCPSSGKVHHYYYKLYALDTFLILNMPNFPTKEDVEDSMKGHILAQTALIGLFKKVTI